ncbi:hypothetical protein L1049_003066 [Liquidambar formosana]|uniref:FHA domain-containing protein n=1 Tax=Liquidambar formosana TaxID=63359 RepID=A0AAP0NLQ9_LIQFO
MTTAMGPPPPKNPRPSSEPQTKTLEEETSSSSTMKTTPMGPPPPKIPTPLKPDPVETQIQTNDAQPEESQLNPNDTHDAEPEPLENATPEPSPKPVIEEPPQNVGVPYTIPPWSEPPSHPFSLEVLKDGSIIDQFDISEKGAYMFGRVDLCDFVLDHPTISRFHAVLQFKRNGDAYIYDLGSTHGTSINKNQVKKKIYVELHVGDVIRFGNSSRLYIFQGPAELMPPETDLKSIRNAKIRGEIQDREASLQRARREASLADGISWGMGEDAIEEAEDDADEITWQTYKGQLTEKQEKTRDKIIKRTEKIANMKKEIDAIRVKDIAQGGLTQGQQTQIARNEQRISQIVEELENLEETLNESIRESMGARTGNISGGKKKGAVEDEEEFSSDDDDFYDRTKNKSSIQKVSEIRSVETADTLLDKKDAIIKEMGDKTKLLSVEKDRMVSETEVKTEAGDPLDAYMSGLSSQLVLDRTEQFQKELSTLQSELDRIVYLLKIADPTGEAARKRDSKVQEPKPNKSEIPTSSVLKQPSIKQKKSHRSEKPGNDSIVEQGGTGTNGELTKKPDAGKIVADETESKTTLYTVAKPQWLGAVEDVEIKESQQQEAHLNMHESDQFVDYRDRKKVLGNEDNAQIKVDSTIESAAPGLIIRKRKQVESSEASDDRAPEMSTSLSVGAQIKAEDAVALLLKHKRGLYAADEEETQESNDKPGENQSRMEKKRPKKVLGPEKPSFLDSNSDYESWVPPEGQSGDGRTSLNDRYGY